MCATLFLPSDIVPLSFYSTELSPLNECTNLRMEIHPWRESSKVFIYVFIMDAKKNREKEKIRFVKFAYFDRTLLNAHGGFFALLFAKWRYIASRHA